MMEFLFNELRTVATIGDFLRHPKNFRIVKKRKKPCNSWSYTAFPIILILFLCHFYWLYLTILETLFSNL